MATLFFVKERLIMNDKIICIKSRNMAKAIFWLTREHYREALDRNKENFTVYLFPDNDRVRRAMTELNHLRDSFDDELNNK